MKPKILLSVTVVVAVVGLIWWMSRPAREEPHGPKPLYYTCSMHPSVRESKPGPCPICGMKLTPVYAKESSGTPETNREAVTVTLGPDSISVIHVQTEPVERRTVRRTLHLAGQISWNTPTGAWFEFTVYERDLQWLKVGQVFDVTVPSVPEKTYAAQIKARSAKAFADADFDMMTGSTKVRAEIANPPIEPGNFGKNKLFNGLHAEAHLVTETEAVPAIPRSAVISRGTGPTVYVAVGNGKYAPRAVRLGRVGDEFCEVLDGLKEGDQVVTTGGVLIDSEAQLASGE